jgi:hypothetical protein
MDMPEASTWSGLGAASRVHILLSSQYRKRIQLARRNSQLNEQRLAEKLPHLLNLPSEIRNAIYGFLLVKESELLVRYRYYHPVYRYSSRLQFLLVCRQIYREASSFAFSKTTWYLHNEYWYIDYNWRRLTRRFKRLRPEKKSAIASLIVPAWDGDLTRFENAVRKFILMTGNAPMYRYLNLHSFPQQMMKLQLGIVEFTLDVADRERCLKSRTFVKWVRSIMQELSTLRRIVVVDSNDLQFRREESSIQEFDEQFAALMEEELGQSSGIVDGGHNWEFEKSAEQRCSLYEHRYLAKFSNQDSQKVVELFQLVGYPELWALLNTMP